MKQFWNPTGLFYLPQSSYSNPHLHGLHFRLRHHRVGIPSAIRYSRPDCQYAPPRQSPIGQHIQGSCPMIAIDYCIRASFA
jgi:hypothetical protein